MSNVIEALRHSPKGQLPYNRSLEEKPLKELLKKCSSSPALSSPHTEITPTRHSLSPVVGLAPPDEEDEIGESGDCTYTEKGYKDSLEIEMGGDVNRSPDRSRKTGQSSAQSLSPEKSCDKSTPSWSPMLEHLRNVLNISDRDGDGDSSLNKSDKQGGLSLNTSYDALTEKYTETELRACEAGESFDNKAKASLEKRFQMFQDHQKSVDSEHIQRLSAVEQLHQQSMQDQRSVIERKHLSRKQDIHKAVQRVKESHDQISRRQDAKLKDVERLEQHLKEEKVRRDQQLDQRLEELRAMTQGITGIKTTVITALEACPHKQHLTASEKTRAFVTKLSEQAEALVAVATRNSALDDLQTKLKTLQEQSQNALDFVNGLIAEAENKAKSAAEEAAKQQQQQQQQAAGQQPQASGGQVTTSTTSEAGQGSAGASASQSHAAGDADAITVVANEYEKYLKVLAGVDTVLKPFVTDQQMKKARFDLQRAVNTPVNAISAVDSAHLRDKLGRLRVLLKGGTVEVTGKQVSASSVPQGIAFCKNLAAKMIAKKADEQVSSNHETAFAVAAVAVGLWAEYADFGKLLMAHLQSFCPYIIPIYPPRLPDQSSADYHRSLGYKVAEDGSVETQDKFLRRMSGLMRLYAAILVTAPPQAANGPHPHGLDHAWSWFARVMDIPPTPDITATSIYDMLQVTGHFMLKAYRMQFLKLLLCLYREFLPKLREVAAGSGPVSRLETFLETTLRSNGHIPEPEGYLPPRFFSGGF